MDLVMNILLNVFEFLGIEHANQIIIFIMVMGLGLMFKLGDMARWVIGVFLMIMGVALVTAIYQLSYDARAQCVYVYDETKPVIADSSTRKLAWSDVREYNCPSLWVARNEIYRRDNYCFYSNAAYSYFREKSGGCDDTVTGPATKLGWDNVKLLGRAATRKGCRVPPRKCSDLGRVSSSRLNITRAPQKGDE
ncbi:MAG: YARHG domain-containing protein [Pseudomonadota bacterium]